MGRDGKELTKNIFLQPSSPPHLEIFDSGGKSRANFRAHPKFFNVIPLKNTRRSHFVSFERCGGRLRGGGAGGARGTGKCNFPKTQ